jgi:hypothetical protein
MQTDTILREIQYDPERSDEEIAVICGVSAKQIAKLRKSERVPKEPESLSAKVRQGKVRVAREKRKKEVEKVRVARRAQNLTYFVADEQGRVKIGQTQRLRKRLLELQRSNADKLTLLGVTKEREAKLHKRFADFRIRGEWFWLTQEVKEWIEVNRDKRVKAPEGF